jgi:hypothetical protein
MDSANREAVKKIVQARPVLIDLRPAREVMTGLGPRTVLHAGPPLPPGHDVSGALRGTIIGAALYEGWAKTPGDAAHLLATGEIELRSAHEFDALGTYCGGITPSAPVMVVENAAGGIRAFNNLNEGRGRALRYGSYAPDVLQRLRWFETTCAPVLRDAIVRAGGVDVFPLIVQALHMGDECHSRHKAATALFAAQLAPQIVTTTRRPDDAADVLRFMANNDAFFLNITMAAAKTALIASEGTAGSSIVTAMARNGVEFGIRVAGCGDRWFTAPVVPVEGQFFEGYGPEDANPDIGDSAIAETLGLGAFALAGAPALGRYMGLTPSRAGDITCEMYKIVHGEHPAFTIPQLDYRGVPSGIDARKVVETGITPITNSGLAHRDGSTGQIGAGFVRTPLKCFRDAVAALDEAVPVRD